MSNSAVDGARAIRSGEELDLNGLRRYFDEHVPSLKGEISLAQFPSGHSNLTYLMTVGDRDVVLRRPPFGTKVKSAHDMGREFKVLTALAATKGMAPQPIAYTEDESYIGSKFYVMERIRGVILRKHVPEGIDLNPAAMTRLCEAFVDRLVDLHRLDYQAIGLGDLGKPEGYVQRQVEGWTKRYEGSQTDDLPVVNQVAKWLADNQPKESGVALIHNDYKLDNLLLDPNDPTRIIGLLDWEMSTIGDPLMDLGTAISYWVEADDNPVLQVFAAGPTGHPGAFTRKQIVERYADKSGRSVDNAVFYYAFGLFKTAVVIQQIYYRYKQGLTQDPRFAGFIHAVDGLTQVASTAIDTNNY